MSHWHQQLLKRQSDLKQQQRWRQRLELVGAQQSVIEFAGNKAELVNFSSNDYLGLANHPQMIEAMQSSAASWGVGSGASHLVCGHQSPHHQLEQALANFVGAQRALLFSTGYMANLAIPSALLSRHDLILQDKLNHASLLDGAQLSRANLSRYPHVDVAQATTMAAGTQFDNLLISSDGVFSMDGDIAPLTQLNKLAQQHDGLLVVDDAHGLGVIGETGRGTLELTNLSPTGNILLMGTLGKGFGSFGAFVAGDEVFIEQLIQTARPYIYTTALPAPVAAASLSALTIIEQQGKALRGKLKARIKQFSDGVKQLGLQLMPSVSAVQPVIIGADQQAVEISHALCRKGFYVAAIRPPTVPEGSARLRFTFSAKHTEQQVADLLLGLKQVCPS